MKRRMKMRKRFVFRLKKRDIFVLLFLLVLFCISVIFYLFNKAATPILLSYAEIHTTRISTIIINEAVNSYVSENTDLSDLVKTKVNDSGEIVSVDFDTNLVNKALISINNTIEANLKYLEDGKLDNLDSGLVSSVYKIRELGSKHIYEIPFGVVFDIPFLSDLGPRIPVKISFVGSVFSDVKTDITPYGINNALLKANVEVTVSEQVILPFLSKKVVVSIDVPVLMKIINGSVPEVYGGAYSISSPISGLTD